MSLSSRGTVYIPSNILQIKLTENAANRGKDGVRRGSGNSAYLYDRHNHTTNWGDADTIECDVIWEYDWVEIPEPIQAYIVARASVLVSTRIVGDTTQYQMLQQQEAYLRAVALEYETQQGQYSFFGHPQGHTDYYQSYQPYQALRR